MNRLDRLQAMLIQLQSKKVVTAAEMAERFEISIRTVYRDIRSLEEAGVPIGAEAGVGYFLDDAFNLPPVSFSREEATALVMGGKLMKELSDDEVSRRFEDALMKIRAVLDGGSKAVLEKLDQQVKILERPANFPRQQTSIFLSDIQQALVSGQLLHMDYYSPVNREHTCRLVEPVGLCFYAFNWHLIAFCRERNDYRDFRLDRIKRLSVMDEKVPKIERHTLDSYWAMEREKGKKVEIELLMSSEVKDMIHESKYWYGMVEEYEQEGSRWVMRFLNPDMEGFARWVLTLGAKVEVIQPKILEKKVSSLVADLVARYC